MVPLTPLGSSHASLMIIILNFWKRRTFFSEQGFLVWKTHLRSHLWLIWRRSWRSGFNGGHFVSHGPVARTRWLIAMTYCQFLIAPYEYACTLGRSIICMFWNIGSVLVFLWICITWYNVPGTWETPMYLVHCTIGSSCTSSWLNLRAPGFARGGRERWTVEHRRTWEKMVEHSRTHWSEWTRVEHRQLLLLKLSGDGDGLMTVLTYQ